MAKREWPQHWPDLLDDLKLAADMGPLQAEIVLLLLMRLVEDAAVLPQVWMVTLCFIFFHK